MVTYITRKFSMAGSPSSGKTSLVRRHVAGTYDDKYLSTLGTVIKKKSGVINGKNLTMLIWDISGQKEFNTIHHAAFKDAAGYIYVCDLTRSETIHDIESFWLPVTSPVGKKRPIVPTIIFANKCDLPYEEAAVRKIDDISKRYGIEHLETSAKEGISVDAGFKRLGEMTVDFDYEGIKNDSFNVVPIERNQSWKLDAMMRDFEITYKDPEMSMNIMKTQAAVAGIDLTVGQPSDKMLSEFNEKLYQAEVLPAGEEVAKANRIRREKIIHVPIKV